MILLTLLHSIYLTLEASKKKQLHEHLRGVNRTPPPAPTPSTVDTIHPIDKKFSTCKKLHLFFQLSESTWRLIGFYDNDSQINNVTSGRHLDFEIPEFLHN